MSYSSSDVTFCIEPISKTEGGMKYKISIKLPMKFGWMENINFVVEKGADKRHYKLNFKENTYESSVFENTIELETCAIYRYYFSLTANGKDLTVSSNGIKWDTEVKRTDMWKMKCKF